MRTRLRAPSTLAGRAVPCGRHSDRPAFPNRPAEGYRQRLKGRFRGKAGGQIILFRRNRPISRDQN